MEQCLAIVEVRADRIELSATECPCLEVPLGEIGACPGPTPGTWMLASGDLEPLLSLLDRCGYHWTLAHRGDPPRTWAERLFAEVPTDHHAALFAACRSALADVPDHLALLEFAHQSVGGPPAHPWSSFVLPGFAPTAS